ncbi:hypothetical protein BpHYR1_053292 [Brachionus plicatilis]|uniref:Uncharacterized protein n=1 Tax=Brachionus plicatilis TaxID=10195 RepID=A0A3M7RJ97_BRAPC|nr:hypothetical protein BpHYR1_053292 [Brachionus plicatilis]
MHQTNFFGPIGQVNYGSSITGTILVLRFYELLLNIKKSLHKVKHLKDLSRERIWAFGIFRELARELKEKNIYLKYRDFTK